MLAPMAALPTGAQAALAPQTAQPTPGTTGVGQSQQQGAATIDAITSNPQQYYRRQVTVSGTVGQMLGPRSFTLRSGQAGSTEIPVVGSEQMTGQDGQPMNVTSMVGRQVQVMGTVHQFNIRAFEDHLNLDLDDNSWSQYAARPSMIATRVTMDGRAQQGQQQATGDAQTVNLPPRTVDLPTQSITVPGQTIQMPARTVEVPAQTIQMPAQRIEVPARTVELPAQSIQMPGRRVELPAQSIQVPNQTIDLPQRTVDIPAPQVTVPAPQVTVPQPTITQPAPVITQPSPTVTQPAPAVRQPTPAARQETGRDVNTILGITPGANPRTDVTVDAILDDPATYDGAYVTVTGDVNRVLTEQSFSLDDSDPLFPEQLLVVSANQNGFPNYIPGRAFTADNQVTVTGVVRTFSRARFQQDFGLTLDANTYGEWEGQPVLVATSIAAPRG